MDDKTMFSYQRRLMHAGRRYRWAYEQRMQASPPIIWLRNEYTGETVVITDDPSFGQMLVEYTKSL